MVDSNDKPVPIYTHIGISCVERERGREGEREIRGREIIINRDI